MQCLLLPERLFARVHIGNMAGQPVRQFHLQLRVERFGVSSRTHSSEQIKEVGLRRLQPGRFSVASSDQYLGRQWQPEFRHTPGGQLGSEKSGRGHANYGERKSIDLVAGTDYR